MHKLFSLILTAVGLRGSFAPPLPLLSALLGLRMWVFRPAIGGAAAASTSSLTPGPNPLHQLVCERRERRSQRIEVVVWLLVIVALAGAYAIVLLMTV